MIPAMSLDFVVKAQSFALMGIADWLSQRNDVPIYILDSMLNLLTTIPIIVGGDLGPEAENEMKQQANLILARIRPELGTAVL